MLTRESFEFVLDLLAQDTERLERVMDFIRLVANFDERADEFVAEIINGQINSADAPVLLEGYLHKTLGDELPASLARASYLTE